MVEGRGYWRETDGSAISRETAMRAWRKVAHLHLSELAGTAHATLTQDELATHVQERTGIHTSIATGRWMAPLLTATAQLCRERREPPLTTLVVQANGTVGPAYDVVLQLQLLPPHRRPAGPRGARRPGPHRVPPVGRCARTGGRLGAPPTGHRGPSRGRGANATGPFRLGRIGRRPPEAAGPTRGPRAGAGDLSGLFPRAAGHGGLWHLRLRPSPAPDVTGAGGTGDRSFPAADRGVSRRTGPSWLGAAPGG
jgi:hypothetical protein